MRVNIGGFLNRFRKQRCSTDQAFSEAFETLPFVHPARYSDGSIPREMNRANRGGLRRREGMTLLPRPRFRLYFL